MTWFAITWRVSIMSSFHEIENLTQLLNADPAIRHTKTEINEESRTVRLIIRALKCSFASDIEKTKASANTEGSDEEKE